VVPATVVAEVIRNNRDPIFTAHPGRKRTLDLISLRYWWPRIRQQVEVYVSKLISVSDIKVPTSIELH
jgi:hypothetical protein